MKKLILLITLVTANYSLHAQVGIGTLTPDVNVALDVNGKVKISGAGQITKQGKVLTSDANGIATWEGAVAFSAEGAVGDNTNLLGGTFIKVLFGTENYDLGNNFTASTFTAPTHGIYQLNSCVSWIAPISYFRTFATLRLIRNGVESTIGQHSSYVDPEMSVSNVITLDYELQQGDQLYFRILHTCNDPRSVQTGGGLCRFSGRMITKL